MQFISQFMLKKWLNKKKMDKKQIILFLLAIELILSVQTSNLIFTINYS